MTLGYTLGTLQLVTVSVRGDVEDLLTNSAGVLESSLGVLTWRTAHTQMRYVRGDDVVTFANVSGAPEALAGTLSYLMGTQDVKGERWRSAPGRGMRLVASEPHGVRHFVKVKEDLALGTYKLVRVKYIYWNDALMMVVLEADRGSALGVREVLEAAYGSGVRDNPYIEQWHWETPAVQLRFEVPLKPGPVTATFTHLPTFREYTGARDAAATEGVRGL